MVREPKDRVAPFSGKARSADEVEGEQSNSIQHRQLPGFCFYPHEDLMAGGTQK